MYGNNFISLITCLGFVGFGAILSSDAQPVNGDLTIFSNAREKIISDILTDYDGKIPPYYNIETPVKSSVQIYIIAVDSINEATMDFSMSFYLRQRWVDKRLNYTAVFNMTRLELDTKQMSNVWVPDLYFINEKNAEVHYVTAPNKLMHIYPDGLVFYSMRVTALFSCAMDLQKYPLDDQKCNILLASYGYSTETLVMRWYPTPVEKPDNLQLPQFELKNITEHICDETYSGVLYACLKLELDLHRNLGYSIIQVYIPSFLVVVLSWVSFWLNVDSTPARISLGLLTVLTMTTQSQGAKASLPRVSYIKAIDIWMSTCLFFVFAALIEFAYVNVLTRVGQRKVNSSASSKFNETNDEEEGRQQTGKLWCFSNLEDKERGRLLDKMSRAIFPAIFLVFNVIYWLVYMLWEPSPTV